MSPLTRFSPDVHDPGVKRGILPQLGKKAIDVHPPPVDFFKPIDIVVIDNDADRDLLEIFVVRREGFERHDGRYVTEAFELECDFFELRRSREVDRTRN
jgi:hypothetical protein